MDALLTNGAEVYSVAYFGASLVVAPYIATRFASLSFRPREHERPFGRFLIQANRRPRVVLL